VASLPGLRYLSTKRSRDVNEMARSIVDEATGDGPKTDPALGKDPAAVELGRKGGLKGGKARAAKLSGKKRSEIAKKAANARWAAHQSSSAGGRS
jgi:hypothetical protein